MNAPAAEFRPACWLRNAHVQSVLASSAVRRLSFRACRARVENGASEHILDCSGGVRLQGFLTRQTRFARPRALVVLLHGWEGSAGSTYVIDTADALLDRGGDVFRLNLRDHGDTHGLNRELFHSCRIDEVVGAVRAAAALAPAAPLMIGGHSLGGNFALRVALRARDAGVALRWAFAICPPLDPRATLRAMEQGPAIYAQYFLHKWRGSLRRKQALFPDAELFTREELRADMRELTRTLVLRHTGFGSLENYLDGYALAGERLAGLDVPASILTAADDPIIPVADFRKLVLSPATELVIVPHGGHCGFLYDASLRSYATDFIAGRFADRSR